jgi:hypothetical protein
MIRIAKVVAVAAIALAPAPMMASTAHAANPNECPIPEVKTPECIGNSHWP